MSEYNNRFSRKPFNKGGNNRFGGDKKLFTAECASCHKTCEVPFRPNGKKPVFCSNCFVKDGESAPRPSFGNNREFSPRPSFDRAPAPRPDNSSFELKRELQGVNDKLERLIRIMEGAVRTEAAAAPKPIAKPASKPSPKPAKPPKKVSKKK